MMSYQGAAASAPGDARVNLRLRRRKVWLVGIAVLALLLAIGGWAMAAWPSEEVNKADTQARLALARQLAAKSLNQSNVNQDLVWLLAIEAGRRAEDVETFAAIREAFAHPGRTLGVLSGHTDSVNQAVWNADESRILTAGNDGAARIWDAETFTELLILSGHTEWVNQALWSTDGSLILTASDDGSAKVWVAATGEVLLTLANHTAWVSQASWNRNETRILTTSDDGTARVWYAASGAELAI